MVLQQANIVRTKAAELNLIQAHRKNELRRLLAERLSCVAKLEADPRTTVAYANPTGRRVATTQPPHSQAHRGKDRNDAGKWGASAKASGGAAIQKPPAKNCEVRNAVATIAMTTTTIPAATVAHPVPTKSLTSYDAYVLFVFAFPKNDNDFESI